MSIFARRVEARAVTYQDVWGSGGDTTNITGADTVTGALRLASVYGATGLIADMIATSALAAYSGSAVGPSRRLGVQPTLVTDPDPYGGTVIDWLHQGLTSVLLTGNAYGYVLDVDENGWPAKVAWLNPSAVSVIERQAYQLGGQASYTWNGRPLDPLLLVPVRGYTFPGSAKGMSPLGLFKTQIETGLEAQSFTRDWFKTGAAPSGHLKNTAQTLTDTESAALKKRFKVAVSNRDPLVTGNDWEWTSLGVPSDQAKFLETIEATATQIAAVYRVSPTDVGGTVGDSLTYKTLLQDQQRLNQRALRPWARRFEEALTRLLARLGPGPGVFAAFDLNANAQGTTLERMQAHAAALAVGAETQDEVRAAENKAPLTDDERAEWLAYAGQAAPVPTGDKGKGAT